MPPKSVTCSICNETVLKAQTLARADGTRACRNHEGVQVEAEARQTAERAERAKHDLEYINAQVRNQMREMYAKSDAQWEKENAEFREYIYSHCWTCGEYGLEGREFFAQALIASKRLQLRGEWKFLTWGDDVRKLMGNIALLVPIKLKNEVVDRAVIKHLHRRVREGAPLLGFILICAPCATKHGFEQRLTELLPKPTWEQIESVGPALQMIDPLVTAMAEKKEKQS